MFGSNWKLIAAIGAVGFITFLVASFTWPQVPALQPYGYEGPRSEEYRPGGAESPAALATIRERRERSRQTDACREKAEEYRLNTNDLIQQTRAADAAKAQAEIASQGLWTAWFQTIGGFLTLSAAIAAAIYARDAANQGKRAADEAQRSADAFVDAESAELSPRIANGSFSQGVLYMELHVTNVGRSAALVQEVAWTNMETADFPEVFVEKMPCDLVIDSKDSGQFPPLVCEMGSDFIGGVVRYRTTFGKQREAYFLFAIRMYEDSGMVIRPHTHYAEPRLRSGWPPNT